MTLWEVLTRHHCGTVARWDQGGKIQEFRGPRWVVTLANLIEWQGSRTGLVMSRFYSWLISFTKPIDREN